MFRFLLLLVTVPLLLAPSLSEAALSRELRDNVRLAVENNRALNDPIPPSAWLRGRLQRDFARTEWVEKRLNTLVFGEGFDRPTPQELVPTLPILLESLLQDNAKEPQKALPQGTLYDIPMHAHPLVDSYVEYFTGRGRAMFRRWLSRADRYRPIMEPILVSHGLPKDTLYLAMIESGFVSHATSVAAAGGFWQFMPATGRVFKLQQNQWIDERRDFVDATHAAARYLKRLHKLFGHWHLAWASYNAGEGRVGRALKKAGVQTYWALTDDHAILSKETEHYVPKVLAATIVAKNRAYYGFTDVPKMPELHYETVTVKFPVSLRKAAKAIKTDFAELKTLNPALRQGVTPPGRSYRMRVPRHRAKTFRSWLKGQKTESATGYQVYRLKRGDSLYRVARRFGTSIGALKDFNQIKNPNRLAVGHRLLVPTLGKSSKTTLKRPKKTSRTTTKKRSKSTRAKKQLIRHVVSSGETLWAISQRYSVSVSSIKRLNRRSDNTIVVGEILRIR